MRYLHLVYTNYIFKNFILIRILILQLNINVQL